MSDMIAYAMDKTSFIAQPTYEDYVASDAEARRIAGEFLSK